MFWDGVQPGNIGNIGMGVLKIGDKSYRLDASRLEKELRYGSITIG